MEADIAVSRVIRGSVPNIKERNASSLQIIANQNDFTSIEGALLPNLEDTFSKKSL
jgi:hypothetical protein